METGIEIPKKQPWKPPTIAELISLSDAQNGEEYLKNMANNDVLLLALNQEPPREWILEHPTITVKVGEAVDKDGKVVLDGKGTPVPIKEKLKYIPIDKQRLLAKRLFGIVEEEIKSAHNMFNGIVVIVRLHFTHPLTHEKFFMDGIGGQGIQVDAGATASDLSKIKFDSTMKAAPSAASYGFKNAYDKLGRAFGGEIQKKAIQFNENWAMFAKEYFQPLAEYRKNKIETLLETSNYDEMQREHIRSIIELGLTEKEMIKTLLDLEMNQLSPEDRGNMSMTEAKKAVKNHL